jgi:hypothetical protein
MCLFVLRVKCVTTVHRAGHSPTRVWRPTQCTHTRAFTHTCSFAAQRIHRWQVRVERVDGTDWGCITFAMASRSGGGGAGPAVQQGQVTVFVGSLPEDKDDKDAYRYQLESGVSP